MQVLDRRSARSPRPHRVGGEMATITVPPFPLSPDEDANKLRNAFQGTTTGISTSTTKMDKELCVRMHL